jgi:hypothetical protein
MKAMPASQYLYDHSKLEETEFALAISPCPQIDGVKDKGDSMESATQRSGPEHRRQPQSSRQTPSHETDLIETLTIGWAIALAIAIALVIYTSGG